MFKEESQTHEEIDERTTRIRTQLKALRSDEIASLAQNVVAQGTILDREIAWLRRVVIGNSITYVKYLVRTWALIGVGIITGRYATFSSLFSVLFFGTGASIVLGLIYFWCLVATAPFVVYLWRVTFGRVSGNLSLVNAADPNIFKSLSQNQCQVAKHKLSSTPSSTKNVREFDFDIAKFLLQLSSLMYERSTTGFYKALDTASETLRTKRRHTTSDTADASDPGQLIASIFDHAAQSRIMSLLREDAEDKPTTSPISTFTRDYAICCEPLSELASTSQAYCSLFWDPVGNWVVVAFKGTDPMSFEEWMTDFTANFADVSAYIPGFKYVHEGFKERLFPADHERLPYHTISAGIKIVTDELAKGKPPGTKIHVWYTGHSLGTAIASLAYSTALLSKDTGSNALLRDAYLFATPIVGDTTCRSRLQMALCEESDVVRSMWRVTNRDDFVATGLPALGDFEEVALDPNNLFNFCHLGVEIFMKSNPAPCQVFGNHFPLPYPGTVAVHVKSDFSGQIKVMGQKNKDTTFKKILLVMQDIPFIGRLAAHSTVCYWDQLDQIAIKGCVPKSREWWQ